MSELYFCLFYKDVSTSRVYRTSELVDLVPKLLFHENNDTLWCETNEISAYACSVKCPGKCSSHFLFSLSFHPLIAHYLFLTFCCAHIHLSIVFAVVYFLVGIFFEISFY